MKRRALGILFAFLFLGSLAMMAGAENAMKAETIGFGAGILYLVLGLCMLIGSLLVGRKLDEHS